MGPPVVDGLHPGGEQRVQRDQVVQFAAGADLDQELFPHRAEHAFDFSSAGWLTGTGMDQPDPQRRAGPEQLLVHKGRPVIDIDRRRNATGRDAGAQRGLKPHRVLPSPGADG
jgi:hypothetical protein